MKTQTLAKAVRSFPAPKGYRGRIIVTAELHNCGNAKAHFSVTAAIGTEHQLQTGDWQAGGCLHDECLSVWPKIAPIIALHLSDEDGQPMHAEANGWYWMAKVAGIHQQYEPDQSVDECRRIAADHFRCSPDNVDLISGWMRRAYEKGSDSQGEGYSVTGEQAARKILKTFVDAQRERWQTEANAGLALIRSFSNYETVAA